MATNNAVNVGLSGSTGTGSFVGSNSPTLVTPVLGAASLTSANFSSTTGIIGTTTNNSAAAGSVGEIIQSAILNASAVSLSNNTPKNMTSISLTAGQWDLYGNMVFNVSISATSIAVGFSQTTNTLPDNSLLSGQTCAITAGSPGLVCPGIPLQLSGTTTLYIVGFVGGLSGTCSMSGGMYAVRRR